MDRFIAAVSKNNGDIVYSLKSNMDRFIVLYVTPVIKIYIGLKSNMDRFIVKNTKDKNIL